MYNLSHFKANNHEEVIAFMKAHPFAMLCGAFANGQPVATQIPMMLAERDGSLFLQGHFTRKQDHHLAFVENPKALVVFTGAHSYISASLYPDPQVVSTWNYLAVHASGTLHFLDDEALHEMLTRLTALFENNPHSPALVERMDDGYVRKMMKAIIGFEVKVEKLDHVFKLSQNKDPHTRERIMDSLAKSSDPEAVATAKAMEAHFAGKS